MAMHEFFDLAVAIGEGALLGVFFFGGLWWTVRQGIASDRVVLWFLGSMLLRMSVVLLGFYFMLGNDWKKLLVGLLGFILARLLVTRLTRTVEPSMHLSQGAVRAP